MKDYLEARFGFASLGLQEKVNEIINLEILDRLPKRLFTVEKIENAEAIIEEDLKAQAKVSKCNKLSGCPPTTKHNTLSVKLGEGK